MGKFGLLEFRKDLRTQMFKMITFGNPGFRRFQRIPDLEPLILDRPRFGVPDFGPTRFGIPKIRSSQNEDPQNQVIPK